MPEAQDGRKRPKLSPPVGRCGRQVTAYLSPDDYRLFYDVVMSRNVSAAETLRQIIREAACSKGCEG